ncbi:hypothetical protein BDZ89DRAFT_1257663 [Hymenopellis radicata]|nr:hypothetical protein BDZ89DRAFT_1257663 [Hymenopellis radicata]
MVEVAVQRDQVWRRFRRVVAKDPVVEDPGSAVVASNGWRVSRISLVPRTRVWSVAEKRRLSKKEKQNGIAPLGVDVPNTRDYRTYNRDKSVNVTRHSGDMDIQDPLVSQASNIQNYKEQGDTTRNSNGEDVRGRNQEATVVTSLPRRMLESHRSGWASTVIGRGGAEQNENEYRQQDDMVEGETKEQDDGGEGRVGKRGIQRGVIFGGWQGWRHIAYLTCSGRGHNLSIEVNDFSGVYSLGKLARARHDKGNRIRFDQNVEQELQESVREDAWELETQLKISAMVVQFVQNRVQKRRQVSEEKMIQKEQRSIKVNFQHCWTKPSKAWKSSREDKSVFLRTRRRLSRIWQGHFLLLPIALNFDPSSKHASTGMLFDTGTLGMARNSFMKLGQRSEVLVWRQGSAGLSSSRTAWFRLAGAAFGSGDFVSSLLDINIENAEAALPPLRNGEFFNARGLNLFIERYFSLLAISYPGGQDLDLGRRVVGLHVNVHSVTSAVNHYHYGTPRLRSSNRG